MVGVEGCHKETFKGIENFHGECVKREALNRLGGRRSMPSCIGLE